MGNLKCNILACTVVQEILLYVEKNTYIMQSDYFSEILFLFSFLQQLKVEEPKVFLRQNFAWL